MICEVPTAAPPQVRRRAVIAGERAQIARARWRIAACAPTTAA